MINVQEIFATDERHVQTPVDKKYQEGAAYVHTPYIPGKYVPIKEASVPITDCGFLSADATYDVVSVSRGMFFRLEDHLNRFENSVKKLRLSLPYSRSEVTGILMKCIRLAGLRDVFVWMGCTRGPMPQTSKEKSDYTKYVNGFYDFAAPYSFIADDEQRKRGLNVIISERYIRIPPKSVDPTVKNFHQLDLRMSLFEAKERGAEWSVLVGADGFIAEGPGVNAFIIKDGCVLTPAHGCLEGITRLTLIDLCKMEGIMVEETNMTAEQFRAADELFLTSTAGGIMPISVIDGRQTGGRKGPGPITMKLYDLYWTKRWEGWHATPVKYE